MKRRPKKTNAATRRFLRSRKKWKRVVDNKLRAYGETNYAKRTIRVNKKRSKRDPMYKRPVNKHAKRYPDLLDTIVHEELHRKHPRMKERTVRKKARRSVTSMSRKRKTRLYSLYG